MIVMRWPAVARAAMPRRAGIVRRSVGGMTVFSLPGGLRAVEAVIPAVVGDLGWAPAREERWVGLPDLDAQGATRAERISRFIAPHLHGQIAVGTRRDRAEHVDLGEELEV